MKPLKNHMLLIILVMSITMLHASELIESRRTSAVNSEIKDLQLKDSNTFKANTKNLQKALKKKISRF